MKERTYLPLRMASVKDRTGHRFGRLTVLSLLGKYKGRAYWRCRCDCGNITEVIISSLINGKSRSCGCFSIERAIETNKFRTHGKGKTREYSVWSAIKQRCTNPDCKAYEKYGAVGIGVCNEWLESFETFLRDMGPRPPGRYTIERIDGSKGYTPSNCKWATYYVQNRNLRSNNWIEWNGERKIISDWAREIGRNTSTILYRIKKGWPMERVLAP